VRSLAASSGALQLVVTAERLFAVHGIDGVSLRQIAAEAGSGNNSAVRYHFGSKTELITAIFGHRLTQLARERQLLAACCDADDPRSRFEAHYRPVLLLAEDPDNRYVSFVEQLQRRPEMETFTRLPEDWRRSGVHRDMSRLLGHLDEPLRWMRIMSAQAHCLHAAAERDRAVANGGIDVPFELFVSALLDGIAGLLSAPPSRATLRHVRHLGDAESAIHRLL